MKSIIYSSYKKFWVLENSFPIIEKLDVIFSTLYTTILHNLVIKVLSEIIHFVFKSKFHSKIGLSASSVYWTSKSLGKRFFTKKNLIETTTILFKSCYFTEIFYSNMVLKQDIVIPMGIDPTPFWSNLFLYFLSVSILKILFLKNQLEHINTMLLVDS